MLFTKAVIKDICIIVCISIIALFIPGCKLNENKKDDISKSEKNSILITKEPITLTYWVNNPGSHIIKNFNESATYKELEKRTGIKIDFIHPVGNWYEQLVLLFASRNFPDIIETEGINSLPGGADQAIEDNVIIRLNELIDEYAPNYQKARQLSDESRKLTITDKGNIYAFSKLNAKDEPAWAGPKIRKDLLDKLNMKPPETMDEWYIMLKAFKSMGVEVPLAIQYQEWDIVRDFGVFIGAYGVNKTFFNDNGTVKYGPIEPGYKEFLKTFNKWYEEGLLDPYMFTRDSRSLYQMRVEGKIGADVVITFDNYETVLAVYPTLNKGDVPKFRQKNWRNRGYEASITTACKYPVQAVKWFDYHYTKEGAALFDLGVEGLNYEMINGEPIATELYVKEREKLSMMDALWKYRINNAPYLKSVDLNVKLPSQVNSPPDNRAEIWNRGDAEGMLPPYTMSREEDVAASAIMSQIQPYVEDMYIKFIMGQASLDQFDDYVQKVKQMGIDEVLKIHQTAYERYKRR